MMERCITCKHWAGNQFGRYDTDLLKPCDHPKMMKGYNIKDEDVPVDGAVVESDEGWAILTAPQFGCVLHEAKPFNTESMVSVINDEPLNEGVMPSSEQINEFFDKE